jgi:hypothetical protein
MISRRSAIGIALAALLSGCATATPYQPATPENPAAGGFSELRLQPDRYRVTFIGNSLTSRKRAERYLLYRAAELTVQHGYDWFEAADQRTEAKPRTIVDPDPFMRPDFMWGGDNGFRRPSWRQSSPRWGGGWRGWDPFWGEPYFGNRTQVRTVDRFEVSAEILLRRGAKPAGDERTHDAREVLSRLGPEIRAH